MSGEVGTPHLSHTHRHLMGRRRSAEEAGDPGGGERGTAKRARNASPRDLVAAANASRDVVSLVVGTDAPDDASTSTRGYVVDQLPDRLRRWCFDLTKRNMEAMYTRTWGWSNPEKRRELAHSDARFLVAFKHKQPHRNDDDAADDDDDTPIGFVHFRFEVEDSDGSPVAYVYELQVEDEMKGRGVGTALMAAVESIAKHAEMTRTALTVLKTNKGAGLFYERRGYVKDPDTPRDEACHYVILTKPTVKRG